jgi:hypothetical protein
MTKRMGMLPPLRFKAKPTTEGHYVLLRLSAFALFGCSSSIDEDYCLYPFDTLPTSISWMGIGWVQAQSWTTFSTHNFNAHASEAKVCGMLLP